MTKLCRAVLILAALAVSSQASQAQPTHGSIDRALADAVIMPAYRHYVEAMRGLAPAITPLCEQPSAPALDAARQGFAAAMDAWQRVQPVAFGPVAEQGRAARIDFWPDQHGTAGRQLRRVLTTRDPALIEQGVAGKSAALQSLSTLERLLFDDQLGLAQGQTPTAKFGCGFALAIARFQQDLAAEILAAWQGPNGFLAAFKGAEAGNGRYFDAAEAQTDLLHSAVTSLDAIVARKLEPPLGKSADAAKPKRAEGWRSGRSLANIIANLETVQALYVTPGGFSEWLRAGKFPALDHSVRAGFNQALATARGIALPLSEAVTDHRARAQVVTLVDQVKTLRSLMASTVADAAGLTLGFNAMDGD